MTPFLQRSMAVMMMAAAIGLTSAADQRGAVDGQTTGNADTAPASSGHNAGSNATTSDGDAKRLFAANCSWCHQDYGMRQGDGPKLAGTSKSEEQVVEQIKHGKTPMPGFEGKLSEKDIRTLAHYIKSLPAN
jgi:mono/diheme cytochrome c family protein